MNDNPPANRQEGFKDNQPEDVQMEENINKEQSDIHNELFKRNYTALRVSVYNFYNKKISLEVTIKSEDDCPNFFVPQSPLLCEVPSNKTKTLSYLHKIHPSKPFGSFSFSFKTDIEPHRQPEEVPPQSCSQEQGVQGGAAAASVPTVTWDLQNDAFEGMQDEINCEQCTLFNPISNIKCDICGAVLPHRK